MSTSEGGKSNFADTGGYGGNFNAGGGGLYNQSASFGGNPTTVSGGVGDYGALQAAASRLGSTASSMNSSANAMMKAAGYVLNKNGVWSTPAQAYQGTSPATRNMTNAEYNAYVAAYRKKLAAVPPVVAPPIPRAKPGVPRAEPSFPSYTSTNLPAPPHMFTPDRPFGTLDPRDAGAGWDSGWMGGKQFNPDNQGLGAGFAERVPQGSGGIDPMTGQPQGRQLGGPVHPGQQYTVGENGPETLQMGANGGGQVIPNNPMDRMGGMNPQMMQRLFQMMRQFGGGQGQQGGQMGQPQGQMGQPQGQMGQMGQMGQRVQDWLAQRQGRPMPPRLGGGGAGALPPGPGQMMPPAQGPGTGGGGWGFGGSGMGLPGIMSRFGGQTQ